MSLIALYFSYKLLSHPIIKLLSYLAIAAIVIFSSLMFVPNLHFKYKNYMNNYGPYSPQWVPYSENIYKEASQQGKGLIIDFYADWCAACVELEMKTFNKKQIHELGKNFIWVKYDATSPGKDYQVVRDKYEIKGLPHIVFYNQSGEYKKESTLFGFENEFEFSKRLKKILHAQ